MLRTIIVEFPNPGTRYCHNVQCRVNIFYPKGTELCPTCNRRGHLVKNLRYEVEFGDGDE